MSRLSLLALALLALVGAAAATGNPEKVEPSELGISIEHVSTVWVQNDDKTVFTYTATVAAGAGDLSHWVLPDTSDGCSLNLVDDEDEWTVGGESVSGATGFVHDFGVDASEDGAVTRTYTIAFSGKVGHADAMISTVSGSQFAMQTVLAPSCNVAGDFLELGSIPADANYSCAGEVPEESAAVDEVLEEKCANQYTLKRSFFIENGEYTTQVYSIINVDDCDAPVFAEADRTHVIECGVDEEPSAADPTVSDNCGGEPSVTDCVEITNGSCPADWTRVKTWTAVDECGNSACFTVTWVHRDTQPPVITDVPADLTLSCTDEIPARQDPTVVDVCSACDEVDLQFNEVTIDGECGNTLEIQRTWTATDCCGNSASATQVISVVDNTDPVLTLSEVTQSTFECTEEVVIPTLTATDDCQDEDPEVPEPTSVTSFPDGTDVIPTCMNTTMYTWTVADDCWNTASVRHVVTQQDMTPPRFRDGTVPENMTVTCDQVPPMAEPECYDECHSVTIVPNEETFPTDCDTEYVLKRSWTCTDACGNSVEESHYIVVVDNDAPAFAEGTIPEDATVQCYEDVPPRKPDFEIEFVPNLAGCNDTFNLSYSEVNSTDDVCDMVITRTWTVEDCVGNSATAEQLITVKDDTDPILVGVPDDDTVECDSIPEEADVGMYDNCDCSWDGSGESPNCNEVTYSEEQVPGSLECTGTYTLNRTWTTTDSCGNEAVESQLINVVDTTAPRFDEEPTDIWSECDSIVERPTLTASDNCSIATVTETPETKLGETCANNYTLEWIYTATDECGNEATFTLLQHVSDSNAPTLSGVPEDETVECDAVPCPADVSATDNCDGLTLEYTETKEPIEGECDQTYYLVRVWTATDACGHVTSDEQRILVQDTTAPVWASGIDDYTVECDAITFPEVPAVSDNCGEVTVTEHHTNGTGSCADSYPINRAYLATDECGNSAWLNYTVTVVDTQAPTLSGVPEDASYSCEHPEPVAITAEDNCDEEPTINTPSDSRTDGDCPYNYTITRTYSATDNCDNTNTETQTITVYDNEAPVLADEPADASYECVAPAAEPIAVSDNCQDDATVEPVRANVSWECVHKYVETRTWTYTDDCQNTVEHVQTITVFDDAAPTITGVPDDETVECNNVPCPATVSATDNCDGIDLQFSEEMVPSGECPQRYSLVRTWTATDECGQTTTESQTVNVDDTTPPDVPAASDISRSCDTPFTFTWPTVTDNCGAVSFEDFDEVVTGDCPSNYTVLHNRLYTDECGNGAWYNFTETVYDESAPSVTSWSPAPPADATFSTSSRCSFPEPPTPTLSDNCDEAPTYSIANDSQPDPECPLAGSITHTYTFVDDCENSASESVTYTITHSTPPTISARPSNSTEECPFDDDEHEDLTCTDACGNTFDAEYDQVKVPGACDGNYTLQRTWTCTDSCGLVTTHYVEIEVRDTTAPSFDVTPGDKTIDYSLTCAEAPFANVTVTDACDPDATVTPRREFVDRICDYNYRENHIFAAADECGNEDEYSHRITYTWNCFPTLTGVPADRTMECSDQPLDVNVTAQDCCGNPIDVNMTVSINETGAQDCDNSFVITRCWTATDICGKTTTECQDISVVDTTAPVIDTSTIPGDSTVECGFVPGYPNVTVTDNCAGVDLWLTVNENIMGDCCWRKIDREWTATDACGNEAVPVHQIINVEDNIPPVLLNVPADVVADCPYEIEDANVIAGEPPLALGWCINTGGADADSCAAEAGDAPSLSGVTLMGGSTGDLEFVEGGSLIRYNDVVGELYIRGKLADASGNEYDLIIAASGLERGLEGVRELNDTCYGPALVDPATWHYYSVIEGNLTGIAGTSTEGFAQCDFSAIDGEPLQNGIGASGRSRLGGVRATLSTDGGVTAGPVLRIHLTRDDEGGCDVGDHLFPRKEILHGDEDDVDHPELECNATIPVNETVTREPICGGAERVTRCWFAEDFHGNNVSDCQVITINDNTNPTLSGVPGPVTVECSDDLPCPADVFGDDTCSNVTLTYSQSEPYDVDPDCDDRYKIRRTWTVVDDCGNDHSESQVITVVDTTAPVFDGVPEEDGLYECGDDITLPTVTATDNCDEDVPVTTTGPVRTDLSCPNHFRMEYTYTAEDDCGNPATDNWKYVSDDTTAPVITPVADASVACDGELPAANPTCSDICDGEITMSEPTIEWFNASACSFYAVRTWTCTDACGNSATPVSQTITFSDDVAPTCEEPADSTIECTEEVPAQASLVCSDNCDEDLTVTTNDFIVDQTCPNNYTQVYQWTVEDCAGLTNSYEQRIRVEDTEAPTLTGVPDANQEVECRDDVTKPEKVCADDACSKVTLVFSEEWVESGVCRDQATATRTWTATDECGHVTTDSYQVIVNDVTPPVCTPIADETVACDAFVPRDSIRPDCSDACNSVSYQLFASQTAGCESGCEGDFHYNWLVTDECGNPTWVNYTVSVNDPYTPEFIDVPADETQECELTAPTAPTASHPCKAIDVGESSNTVPGGCPYNFTTTYTWTAVGCCGETVTETTTITVQDSEAPTIEEAPADVTVACTGIPPAVSLQCTDGCEGSFTAAFSEDDPARGENECVDRVITRTWTCTDSCGHSTSAQQLITVADNEAPELQNVPANMTQECDSVDTSEDVTATDDCDDDLEVLYSDSPIPGSCADEYTIRREWSVTDDCGNSDSAVRFINVVDTTDPTFDVCECDGGDCVYCAGTASCEAPPANPALPSASDNCDNDVAVTPAHSTTPGACAHNYTRNFAFLAEDNCGNTAWLNYSVEVTDEQAPEFESFPDDATEDCWDLQELSVPTASDNCANGVLGAPNDPNFVVDTQSNKTDGECENYQITHTWTITDECGNSFERTQTITVVDNDAPTFDDADNLPTDFTVECDEDPVPATLTASDRCGSAEVTFASTPVADDDECDSTRTEIWTWTATDLCGNTAEHNITVTWVDTTAPTLVGVPADTTVECTDIPCPATVTANDNCGGIELTFSETATPGSCDGEQTIVRTWTATDCAGNSVTESQTINVIDSVAPELEEAPADETIECGPPAEQVNLTCSDNCSDCVVSQSEVFTDDGCANNYTLTRTWSAVDACGSVTTDSQTVVVRDTLPPVAGECEPMCWRPIKRESYLLFEAVSEPETGFFCVEDECSDITIELTGCTSNQDAALDASDAVFEIYENGFTSHCFWSDSDDKLWIFPVLLQTVAEGRTFTVTATATDACGHSVDVEREIFIPLNETSLTLSPYDFEDYVEDCSPIPYNCTDLCPCESENNLCEVNDALQPTNVTLERTYDGSTDTTTFTWTINGAPIDPTAVRIGVDLNEYEPVSPAASVGHGFDINSYVGGLRYDNSDGISTFSVTLAGQVARASGNTPIQFFSGSLCTSPRKVAGPSGAAVHAGGSSVTGTVAFTSFSEGNGNFASVPIQGAVVELISSAEGEKVVFRTAYTDASGNFEFEGVTGDLDNDYKVQLRRDGVLSNFGDLNFAPAKSLVERLFGPGVFAVGETVVIDIGTGQESADFPYGGPVDISGGSADVNVVFSSTREPLYVRDTEGAFYGNSYSTAFWDFQLDGEADRHEGFTKFADAEISGFLAEALATIPAGCVDGTSLSTGTEAEARLLTVALNTAAGKGVFEPYDVAAQWVFDICKDVVCNGGSAENVDICNAQLARVIDAGNGQ